MKYRELDFFLCVKEWKQRLTAKKGKYSELIIYIYSLYMFIYTAFTQGGFEMVL